VATNAENATALRTAIATGVKSTTIDGITVTYQDTSAMLSALALFERRATSELGEVTVRRVAVGVASGIQRYG